MKVYAQGLLTRFSHKHANAGEALDAWLVVIERSTWRTPQEIKEHYPSADFLANNRVIFNIKGNHFRLVVKINYRAGTALIEWIGTHAEYDKQTFQ